MSGANLNLSPGLNTTLTITINDVIADDSSKCLTGAGNSATGNGLGGNVTLQSGTLQAGTTNVLLNSSTFNLTPGTQLDLNNFSQSIGLLTGSGNVTLGSGTLTISSSNSGTFDGVISGTGGLTCGGAVSLTLTNPSNNWSGATQLNGGTLIVGAQGTLSGSSITFGGNATLQFNANYNLATIPIILNSAGTINVGSNNVNLSVPITGSSGLTLSGTGSLTLLNPNILSSNSCLTLQGGSTLNLNNFSQSIPGLGGSGNISLGSATLTINSNCGLSSYSGVISGTGGVTINGEVNLESVQNYTGPTIITTVGGLAYGGNGRYCL